ncbi:RING-H2 finger protein ATL66 [Prunus avium]|uniref:RING-type E3 ubiquitin transferase n=1 Tax=Prunus avium TaxID=42229 RepID=A0A6P5RL67_PRUAV|nr:RING-H2 finger protein ATL66 [Prunus avium]
MASSSQQSQPFDGHFTVLDDAQFHIRGRTLFFVVILFTVVLLVTVLMLYARWVCHYYPNTSSLSNAPPNAPPQSQPKGLDPAVIRALPIVLYQQSDRDLEAGGGGGGECCICLGVFGDGEKVKVLPSCSHWYHSECVDAWLATRSSCPLCRAQLQAQSTSS